MSNFEVLLIINNAAFSYHRWLCGNIEQHSVEVETAIVRFTAPVYGTMYLRQPKSQPDEDTTVLIELANMVKRQYNAVLDLVLGITNVL